MKVRIIKKNDFFYIQKRILFIWCIIYDNKGDYNTRFSSFSEAETYIFANLKKPKIEIFNTYDI